MSPEPARPRSRIGASLTGSLVAHAVALATSAITTPSLATVEDEVSTQSFVHVTPGPELFDLRDPGGDEPRGAAPHVCGELPAPAVGHSVAVRGPRDNPDPHIARMVSAPDPLALATIGPLRGSSIGNDGAPVAPWGRDDALGNDPYTAHAMVPGPLLPELATCFGDPPASWRCDELSEPSTPARAGLALIGDAPAAPLEPPRRRPGHVALGPLQVAANVPARLVVAAVRETIDGVRACYDRARSDDPALAGRLDVVLRVRGDEAIVTIRRDAGTEDAAALACCVERVHDAVPERLPPGTRGNALYSFAFGRSPAKR